MNIAIVFGGKSFEHDVSIVTAKQIYNVANVKHNVSLVYIDKNDNFTLYANKEFCFDDFKGNHKFLPLHFDSGRLIYKNGIMSKSVKIDCAIVCCHGGNGENGVVQSALSMAKIPVSSGSQFALACAMNKWQTKNMLKALKINTINGVLVHSQNDTQKTIELVETNLSYPVIVKPNNGGSSIGIEIAKNREELQKALQIGFCFDSQCLVETALENFEEYNQAVLGCDDNVELSYIECPTKAKDILSFEDKYLSSSSKTKCGMKGVKRKKINLSAFVKKRIDEYSQKIFCEFSFFGVVRIDYIYDKINKKLYVNEINSVPGSLAIYFFAEKHSALWFVDKLIEIAIKKYKENLKINKNYATKLF